MAGLRDIRKIAIVGSGIMGSGITQISLLSGFETVVLNDIDESALKKSRDAIASVINALADKDRFKESVSSYKENLSSDFGPAKAIVELVKAGRLGRKTGRGIYEWDESGNAVIKETQAEEKTLNFLREQVKNPGPEDLALSYP